MSRQKILCGCRRGFVECTLETVGAVLQKAADEACSTIKKKSRQERYRQLVEAFARGVDTTLVEEVSVFNRGLQINIKTKLLPVVIAWYPSTGVYVYGSKRMVGSAEDLLKIVHEPPATLVALYGSEVIL